MISTTPRRLTAFAFAAAVAFAACSSSGSSSSPSESASAAAPSAAAPSASAAAPSTSAAASASAAAAGGSPPPPTACETGSIVAAGSTALQPLVDAGGKVYVAGCSGSTISVQGGGSGTGLTQVLQGAVQIGNSDVTADSKLKPDEASQLVNHDVAKQGWVMVVSKDVTGVTSLTSAQATDIWTGKTTNWKDVGGPDLAIVLILRPESSGTRATFKKIVLGGAKEATGQALTEDSNGAVTAAVKTTPGSTSVIGFAYYQSNKADLTALGLDGVEATVDNMTNGTYKLSAIGHMYTKGEATGLAKSFIDYMLSPGVQTTLLPSLYYAPVAS